MPTRSSKKPRDLNRLASAIVQEATGEAPEVAPSEKNPHAVALARLGGMKGGKARANKLTPEQRREIARKAAKARWAQSKG
jgi:hypothetical protein